MVDGQLFQMQLLRSATLVPVGDVSQQHHREHGMRSNPEGRPAILRRYSVGGRWLDGRLSRCVTRAMQEYVLALCATGLMLCSCENTGSRVTAKHFVADMSDAARRPSDGYWGVEMQASVALPSVFHVCDVCFMAVRVRRRAHWNG